MRITANGISIHYTLNGPASAPVVTLSHSLATNLAMWEPQAAALAARYRVLRYDTRGHGGTDAPAGPYSLDQLADDAVALLRGLGIERTHFVGLSMGGMIGQVLALKQSEQCSGASSSATPPAAFPPRPARYGTSGSGWPRPRAWSRMSSRPSAAGSRRRSRPAPRGRRAGARHDPADEAAGVYRLLPCDQGARPDRSPDGAVRPHPDRRGRGRPRDAGRRRPGDPRADHGVGARRS